jgi:uncharacterized membrane protein YkoI
MIPRDGMGVPRTSGVPSGGIGGDLSSNFRVPNPDTSGAPRNADVVPLTNVVSMVQERFNATAVKTDTVVEDDQMVYRIRLLSADKSRVWTVRVDARTGQVK